MTCLATRLDLVLDYNIAYACMHALTGLYIYIIILYSYAWV